MDTRNMVRELEDAIGREIWRAALAGVLKEMGDPETVTIAQVKAAAVASKAKDVGIALSICRNRRTVTAHMKTCGYVPLPGPKYERVVYARQD
jgi:hypothetical protein